jgi:hypothetical protein
VPRIDIPGTVVPHGSSVRRARGIDERIEIAGGWAMARIMPSQVVQTIDELFPHAARNDRHQFVDATAGPQLLGILNLLRDVPDELIVLTQADYSELVLAKSTIEDHLAHWRSRGIGGNTAHVKEFDVVTVIRRALAKCPDEYPPSTTTELLFINDAALRENIRRDWVPRRGPSITPNGRPQQYSREPRSRLSCIGGYRSRRLAPPLFKLLSGSW